MHDSYLVIGGCGFLGKHVVDALLNRGEPDVAVFDLKTRDPDPRAHYFAGDLTNLQQLEHAIQERNVTCVIHTASPEIELPSAIYWKVNVQGTRTVIDACARNNVQKLVYTSSVGVVFDCNDSIDVDETWPIPEKAIDAYHETKAKAEEMVLHANGRKGLQTCALRPGILYGPGAWLPMSSFAALITSNATHYQIGDNTSYGDWVYVTNVADAHLLAADRLSTPYLSPEDKEPLHDSLVEPLGHIKPSYLTVPQFDTPSHSSSSKWSSDWASDWESQSSTSTLCFDRAPSPSSDTTSICSSFNDDLAQHPVAGQVFIITNGDPIPFWSFARSIWRHLGHVSERRVIIIPRTVAMWLAWVNETVHWCLGKEARFTRYKLMYSCTKKTHKIDKARKVLGYEPKVGVQEGIQKMVEWWLEVQSKLP